MKVTATFEDPTGRYLAQADLMQRNAVAGFNLWARHLADSFGEIEIRFHLVTNYPNRGGGSSPATVTIGQDGGVALLDGSAAYELRTGIDANGASPDIDVFFDADFLTARTIG